MTKNVLIAIIAVIFIGGGIGLAYTLKKPVSQQTPLDKTSLAEQKAIVYKTPNCGCCKVYTKYLPEEGIKTESNDISQQELTKMQRTYGIPDSLSSCHITQIGDYFVSGHIPIKAIAKLLTEKPDIAGIALAGMPSGTPGMPGPKNEDWVIYSIGNDGSTSEFMTI